MSPLGSIDKSTLTKKLDNLLDSRLNIPFVGGNGQIGIRWNVVGRGYTWYIADFAGIRCGIQPIAIA